MRFPQAKRHGDDATSAVDLLLPPTHFAVVDRIPAQLRELFLRPDRSPRVIDRLFPPTYADPARQAEHRRLLGESLLERRRDLAERLAEILASAETTRGGVRRIVLLRPDVDLLLQVINDYRLMLGTELDVSGNDWSSDAELAGREPERFFELALTSEIQEALVAVMVGEDGTS